LPVVTEHLGPILLKPVNCARGVPQSPSFSWTPFLETTKYEFILAEDAALTQIVEKVNVSTTAYEYEGSLNRNTVYFWQVRAVEPAPSEPSPVANFIVVSGEEPSVVIPAQPSSIPFWIWPIIAIYAALAAAMIALAIVKPRHIKTKAIADSRLDSKLSPVVDRPKSPLAKFRSAVTMRIRRRRYLRKPEGVSREDVKVSKMNYTFNKTKHVLVNIKNTVIAKVKGTGSPEK